MQQKLEQHKGYFPFPCVSCSREAEPLPCASIVRQSISEPGPIETLHETTTVPGTLTESGKI